MKTYNGKNITKKEIKSTLRSMNPTQIFRLVHIIYGGKVSKSQVYDFIKEYAPNSKVWNKAWELSHCQKHVNERNDWSDPWKFIQFQSVNEKHIAVQALRKEIARPLDAYSKRPIMGNTHLYFASPVFRHSDYNKWRSIEIKGNERFCEVICRLADKYFQ